MPRLPQLPRRSQPGQPRTDDHNALLRLLLAAAGHAIALFTPAAPCAGAAAAQRHQSQQPPKITFVHSETHS